MGYRSDIDAASGNYTALAQRVEDLEMGISLALKYDQDADPPSIAYLGQALPGTADSAPGWKIQKLTFGAGGDVTVTWADGNADFDNVWNDRAILTYS